MKKISLIIILLINSSAMYSQWSAGASYEFKSNFPKQGFGLEINRNLPLQAPTIGVKVSVDGNFMSGKNNNIDLAESNINASLIGTLFYRVIQPYFGFGLGYSFYSESDLNDNSLTINVPIGLQFALFHPVYPFIEAESLIYFSPHKRAFAESNTIQIFGSAGVRIEF